MDNNSAAILKSMDTFRHDVLGIENVRSFLLSMDTPLTFFDPLVKIRSLTWHVVLRNRVIRIGSPTLCTMVDCVIIRVLFRGRAADVATLPSCIARFHVVSKSLWTRIGCTVCECGCVFGFVVAVEGKSRISKIYRFCIFEYIGKPYFEYPSPVS